jgi:hypothetical protein
MSSLQLKLWKTRLAQLTRNEADFEKWLFVQISGVLLGGKSGELLSLPVEQFSMSMDEQAAVIAKLSEEWGLCCHILYKTHKSIKIIIFNETKVARTLNCITPCMLSEKMNYTGSINPAGFVREIAERWQKQDAVPHEIGLALGYPIKDVLGFMGLNSLECTGVCGWKIYGSPDLSFEWWNKYKTAKEHALNLIE